MVRTLIPLLCLLAFPARADPLPTTDLGWSAWVEQQSETIVRDAGEEYQGVPVALPRRAQAIAEIVALKNLRAKPVLARFTNFFNFIDVARLSALPGHSMGFAMSDADYIRETSPLTEIPDALRDPGFLANASRTETLPAAKRYLDGLNAALPPERRMTFFSYRSQFLGTPDRFDVMGRLLVVVPGEPEKWVQFGVADAGDPVRVRNVSVVSVERHADGSHTPYFKDHYRTYAPDGSITLKSRFEVTGSMERCYSCHKMGIAPIFPEPGSVPADELGRVKFVNRLIKGYGRADYGRYLDMAHFGPGMGQTLAIEPATLAAISADEAKIRRAMNCAACHNARSLGELTYPMRESFAGKWVLAGKMPPGVNLADPELKALHSALVGEYFSTTPGGPGILANWLRTATHEESGQAEFLRLLRECRDAVVRQFVP